MTRPAPASPATDTTECFRLPLEKVTLANGLTCLLHPDDSLPLAAVHVCYHVGSKDESPEKTGLAHLFEHLMFEGSANHDDEYFRPLQEAGAAVNGSTGHDYTSYYEVVPSNFLERALWLEADRMGRLLEVLSPAKLENQRAVVKNERLQRIDNQPYGRVSEEMFALLYEAGHPYHWPIIGWMEHLDQMTLEDTQEFFRRYYTPANAVLVISGKFERAQALDWLQRYFGSLPATPRPTGPPVQVPVLRGEYRRLIEEPVALARIDLLWPTVPRFHPDEPALDLASLILGDGKDSPLRKRLERDEKIAHSVDAYHSTFQLAGQFGIWAYGLPGIEPSRLETVIGEILSEFRRRPVDNDDLLRAKRWFAQRAYSRVETVLGKAEMLQHYVFHKGEPTGSELAGELEAYERVTPADIAYVFGKYVLPRRVAITVRPSKSAENRPVGKLANSPEGKHRTGKVSESLPSAGPVPTFEMPTSHRRQVGSLPLVVLPSRKLPRVTMQLVLDAGSVHESDTLLGVARMTADCLDEGTQSQSGLEIARRLELLGGTLAVGSGIESVTMTLRTLRSTLKESFAVFADVLTNPLFAEVDFERERDRLSAELAHKESQPRSLADDAIDEEIFGKDHPYGRSSEGTLNDLARMTRDDMVRHYQRRYCPGRATLVVVGDVSPEEIADLAGEQLSTWMARPVDEVIAPIRTVGAGADRARLIARSESTQSVLRVGRTATYRKSPDYEAMVLLNMIVGGQFSSRLNTKLREEQGFTYGVHSSFVLRREGGSFLAGTDVDSRVTIEALRSLLDVIRRASTTEPITQEELTFAQKFITRRFPARFETQSSVLSQLAHLVVYDLPDDYYAGYLSRISAVTLPMIHAAAERYLGSEGWRVVVVGKPELEKSVVDVTREVLG